MAVREDGDSALSGGLLVILGIIVAVILIFFIGSNQGWFGDRTEEINIETPNVNVPTPQVEAPDVDVRAPDVNVDTPDVNVDTPDVNVDSPDLNVDVNPNRE